MIEANAGLRQEHPKRTHARVAHTHRNIGETPKTPGERMIKRRKELGLRQEDVAEQVIVKRRDGTKDPMSRSGYCMYEQDSVTHDITKIALIARVLKTTPEWLAYGVSDRNSIEQVEATASGDFTPVKKWKMDDDWVYDLFEAESADVSLWRATNSTEHVYTDDIVMVKRGAKPGPQGGEFVFEERGKAKIAFITKPSRTSPYVIKSRGKEYEAVESDIGILGRAVGRFGLLS